MSEQAGRVDDRRLEQRYRELCDFVSIVAHDLRTPLTSIRGFAQLLHRQAGAENPQSLQSGLGTIMEQSDRLAEQTEWLLEIARLETGRVALSRTRVDLESVAREEVAALDAPVIVSNERGASPIIVDADVRRLRQMVRAMVQFAAERSAPPSSPSARSSPYALFGSSAPAALSVAVSVAAAGADGHGRLVVEDQGVALDAAERAGLLERLVDTSEDGRRRSLAHVDLVIAAGMAAAHGGRLHVESPVQGGDRGLRLSLYLPLAC